MAEIGLLSLSLLGFFELGFLSESEETVASEEAQQADPSGMSCDVGLGGPKGKVRYELTINVLSCVAH